MTRDRKYPPSTAKWLHQPPRHVKVYRFDEEGQVIEEDRSKSLDVGDDWREEMKERPWQEKEMP